MNHREIIDTLRNFKAVDKYEAFQKIVPSVGETAEDRRSLVENILDTCCMELIQAFEYGTKPAKALLKQIIFTSLDKIKDADVDEANRDFGYELCWYLSEKAGLNLKLSSSRKVWGYWAIEADTVKTISHNKRRAKFTS